MAKNGINNGGVEAADAQQSNANHFAGYNGGFTIKFYGGALKCTPAGKLKDGTPYNSSVKAIGVIDDGSPAKITKTFICALVDSYQNDPMFKAFVDALPE